jgi:hypothetical protein
MKDKGTANLLVWYVDIPIVNPINDVMRRLPIYRAPDALSRAQDLLHRPAELLRQALRPHRPRDVDDLVEGDVARVLDVLLLLPVARGLLEGFDDEGGGGGDDGDGGLAVLDGELDGDAEAFPLAGGFGDIFTDLFW